jgi:hypothetical protein
MANLLRAQPLTHLRVGLAIAVAAVADLIQFLAGPMGWVGFDQAVDFVAMVLTILLLGFHVLLLPTFILELVPVVGELPTWTGCVGAVILLRKRAERAAEAVPSPAPGAPPLAPKPSHPPATGPIIDV